MQNLILPYFNTLLSSCNKARINEGTHSLPAVIMVHRKFSCTQALASMLTSLFRSQINFKYAFSCFSMFLKLFQPQVQLLTSLYFATLITCVFCNGMILCHYGKENNSGTSNGTNRYVLYWCCMPPNANNSCHFATICRQWIIHRLLCWNETSLHCGQFLQF